MVFPCLYLVLLLALYSPSVTYYWRADRTITVYGFAGEFITVLFPGVPVTIKT
jgi:hypothetical protein